MKLINILYDYEYCDIEDTIEVKDYVDIVKVPDFVCSNLDEIVQEFFDWVSNTKNHNYYIKNTNGDEVLAIGTNEFIKWLNENYKQCEDQEIILVKAHTDYNPNYPSALF